MQDDTDLGHRKALPEALRVLARDYPRDLWQSHAAFDGLIRFWLERHAMFRALLDRLSQESAAIAKTDSGAAQELRNTARLGQALVSELHGHHQIEDLHYFPRLSRLEPRLERGFDILDRDHHALDGHLAHLADTTNALIRAEPILRRERADALQEVLFGFGVFLDRHLTDEEDLVVPILLRHGESLGS